MDTLYQAAKWLQLQTLLDPQEMQILFQELGDFSIFITGSLQSRGNSSLSAQDFLSVYTRYIQQLQSGTIPSLKEFQQVFASVFTKDTSCVRVKELDKDREMVQVVRPVVQLQMHQMGYSPLDGKFRSMVRGKESIAWGVQFSYPQLFQDPETGGIEKVDERYPNTELFRTLQKWMRKNTIPTPFIVDDQKVNVPIRLGKMCFGWINSHPQLGNLRVAV